MVGLEHEGSLSDGTGVKIWGSDILNMCLSITTDLSLDGELGEQATLKWLYPRGDGMSLLPSYLLSKEVLFTSLKMFQRARYSFNTICSPRAS